MKSFKGFLFLASILWVLERAVGSPFLDIELRRSAEDSDLVLHEAYFAGYELFNIYTNKTIFARLNGSNPAHVISTTEIMFNDPSSCSQSFLEFLSESNNNDLKIITSADDWEGCVTEEFFEWIERSGSEMASALRLVKNHKLGKMHGLIIVGWKGELYFKLSHESYFQGSITLKVDLKEFSGMKTDLISLLKKYRNNDSVLLTNINQSLSNHTASSIKTNIPTAKQGFLESYSQIKENKSLKDLKELGKNLTKNPKLMKFLENYANNPEEELLDDNYGVKEDENDDSPFMLQSLDKLEVLESEIEALKTRFLTINNKTNATGNDGNGKRSDREDARVEKKGDTQNISAELIQNNRDARIQKKGDTQNISAELTQYNRSDTNPLPNEGIQRKEEESVKIIKKIFTPNNEEAETNSTEILEPELPIDPTPTIVINTTSSPNRSHPRIPKNAAVIVHNESLELEAVGYGEVRKDGDYSSLKINNKLILISKVCGLHMALIDSCKDTNNNPRPNDTELNQMIELYNSIKIALKKKKLRLDVTCFDTFETAKIRDSAYLLPEEGDTYPDYSIPKEILITCPSRCQGEPDAEQRLENIFNKNDEICSSAIKENVIDINGGTFLVSLKPTRNSYDDLQSQYPSLSESSKSIETVFSIMKYTVKDYLESFDAVNTYQSFINSFNQSSEEYTDFGLKLLAAVEETLNATRYTHEVKFDQMKILVDQYNYKDNAFKVLTNMLNKFFPQINIASEILGTLAIEEKFLTLMREVQNAPIYSAFLNPSFPRGLNNDDFLTNDKVIFSKTFEICPENNPQTFMGELARLKQIINLMDPMYNIMIASAGRWFTGVDKNLIELLQSVGASSDLTSFYDEYKADFSKSDVSLALIGWKDAGPSQGITQVTQSLINHVNEVSIETNLNPTRTRAFIDILKKPICPPVEPNVKRLEPDLSCTEWSCIFYWNFVKVLNNIKPNNGSKQYIDDAVNKSLTLMNRMLESVNIEIQLETVKGNPMAVTQFIYDFPKVNTTQRNVRCCKIILKSSQEVVMKNNPDSMQTYISSISFGSSLKEFSYPEKQNALLFIRISKDCQRRVLGYSAFKSGELKGLDAFLQSLEEGEIVAFVQHGSYDWEAVRKTTLTFSLNAIGMASFKSLPDSKFLKESATIFAGKVGMSPGEGILHFSFNSEINEQIDICHNEKFSICTSDLLYVRTEGNLEKYTSPMRTRMVVLNDEFFIKNDKVGITILVLQCATTNDKTMKYAKSFEKNYDLYSSDGSIENLNRDLKNLISKDYSDTPLFIITTYGNYDIAWEKDSKGWSEFSYYIKKLGGGDFLMYLNQYNYIMDNGHAINMGHPYILVGSPKFQMLSATEYKFRNFNMTAVNDLYIRKDDNNIFAEVLYDLNKHKLNCPHQIFVPQPLKNLSDIVNYTALLSNKTNELEGLDFGPLRGGYSGKGDDVSILPSPEQKAEQEKAKVYRENLKVLVNLINSGYKIPLGLDANDILAYIKNSEENSNFKGDGSTLTNLFKNESFLLNLLYDEKLPSDQVFKLLEGGNLTTLFANHPQKIWKLVKNLLSKRNNLPGASNANKTIYFDLEIEKKKNEDEDEEFLKGYENTTLGKFYKKMKEQARIIQKEKNCNESMVPQFNLELGCNFTQVRFRGLILGNANDKVENFLIKNNTICESMIEQTTIDKDLGSVLEIFKDKTETLQVFIYSCFTRKSLPPGAYYIDILTLSGKVLKGAMGKIMKTGEFYEIMMYSE